MSDQINKRKVYSSKVSLKCCNFGVCLNNYNMIAETPPPPYYAVIFSSIRTRGDNGYPEMAEVKDVQHGINPLKQELLKLKEIMNLKRSEDTLKIIIYEK